MFHAGEPTTVEAISGVSETERRLRSADDRPNVLIELSAVSRRYAVGTNVVVALADVSIRVAAEDFVVVLGPSGSGKTTLLNIIGALASPSEGRVVMAGQDITRTSRKELFAFRRQGVSFVLQTAARRPRQRVPVRARHEPRRSRDREAGRGGPERARWRQGYGPLPDPHRAKQLSADLHNASGDGNPHQSAAIPLLHEPSGRGRHGPGRPCQPRLVHPRRRATCSRCETSVPCDGPRSRRSRTPRRRPTPSIRRWRSSLTCSSSRSRSQ